MDRVGSDVISCGANDTTAAYDMHTHTGLDDLRSLDEGEILFLETMSDGREGWDVMTHSAMKDAGDVSDRLSEWKWGGNLFLETFSKVLFLEIFGWYVLECAYGLQKRGSHGMDPWTSGGLSGRCGPAEMDFCAMVKDEWICPYWEYIAVSCRGTKDGGQDGMRYLPAMRESSGSEGKWATD